MADDTPETMPEAPAGTPAQTSAEPPVDTMADTMAEPTTDGPADLTAEEAGAATVEPGGGESGTDPISAGPREGAGEADALGPYAAATPLESQPAATTSAEPEPAPAAEPPAPAPTPEPEPEPEAAPAVVAATLEVPPLPGSSTGQPPSGEGGEWELLTGKVRQWLASGQLQNLWDQARTPLTALAVLTGLIVVLRIYSALLAAIDSVPLASGLLELTGVLWLARYGLPRLVRSQERHQLVSTVRQRWESFFGRR